MRLRLALLLVLVLALVAGCRDGGGSAVPPLDRLSSAVTGVATARSGMLGAVNAVEVAGTAVDDTDALCAKGEGRAARDRRRTGAGQVKAATSAVANLPTLVANYRAALDALQRARTAVDGPARTALEAVVRDGRTEAAAYAAYAEVVRTAWQQYANLDRLEGVWITRSTAGWYRTKKEGGDAYAVLVSQGREFVVIARKQLGDQGAAVRGPTSAQSATLAAADKALKSVRARG